MIQTLKKLFGFGPKTNYTSLVKNGAIIIDVRTPSEFKSGHIKGSRNIPLDGLQGQVSKISKDQVIITCCASGIRSASAKGILKSAGFMNVYNGGGWMRLNSKL